jgi:hypothetical protein
MIVRRIADHLKAQNWMALGLELLVVIIGLFLGLQLNAWWQDQSDRRMEQRYLVRLAADNEANQVELERLIDRHRRIAATVAQLDASLRGEAEAPTPEELSSNLCRWFVAPMPLLRRGTYAELVSTGHLSLLRDDGLRTLLERIEADRQASDRLDMFNQFLPAVFEPLDEHRQWAIDVGEPRGYSCRFDLDGLGRDPRMPSVLAQMYRLSLIHAEFLQRQTESALALQQQLSHPGVQDRE